MGRILNKYFIFLIYFIHFSIMMIILYQLRSHYLLPVPELGTDQRAMLSAAAALSQGIMWPQTYLYSPLYTIFLSVLVILSRGEILVMRILQASICGLIPVMIYKTARNTGLSIFYSQISALIYCFYAASTLISLDFLRAAPLSLVFISYAYFLLRAYRTNKIIYYVLSGLFASACVLGRENFLAVVFLPLFMLTVKSIRLRILNKKLLLLFFSAAIPVFSVCAVNFFRFDSFSILPGNAQNVLSFYYPNLEISLTSIPFLLELAKRCVTNFFKYISPYEIPNSLSVYAHSDFSPMLRLLFIPFHAIFWLAFSSLRIRPNTIFLGILSGGYILSMLIFEPFYRFRIPVVPILCVMCGFGIKFFAELRRKCGASVFLYIISFIIFIILLWENPQPKRTLQERIATIKVLANEGLFDRAKLRLSELESEGYDISNLSVELEKIKLEKENK